MSRSRISTIRQVIWIGLQKNAHKLRNKNTTIIAKCFISSLQYLQMHFPPQLQFSPHLWRRNDPSKHRRNRSPKFANPVRDKEPLLSLLLGGGPELGPVCVSARLCLDHVPQTAIYCRPNCYKLLTVSGFWRQRDNSRLVQTPAITQPVNIQHIHITVLQ